MRWYKLSPIDAMKLPYSRRRRIVLARKDAERKQAAKSGGTITRSI